jgi:hypothetical protein
MKTHVIKALLAVLCAPLVAFPTVGAVPAAPQNVAGSWVTPFGIFATYWHAGDETVLVWDAVPDATSYTVYRFDDTTSTWVSEATGLTDTNWRNTFPPLSPTHYVVSASNSEGESAPSPEVIVSQTPADFVTITQYLPNVFANDNITQTNAWLAWMVNILTGADGLVELGLDGVDFETVYHNPTYQFGHSLTLSNLTPNTIYWYRVTTVGTNRGGITITNWFHTLDINHAPVANNITLGPLVDPWPITIELTASDQDMPMYPLEFSIVTSPTNGVVSSVYYYSYYGPRYVDYTPNPGARGTDVFQYVASDGELPSLPATVTITNIWLNRAPEAASFSTNTLEDVPLPLYFQATDPDGDPLSYTVWGSFSGTVTGTPPNVVYVPNPNFHGSDIIIFDVQDGYIGGFAQGVINIEVESVNDAPVAPDRQETTAEDVPTAIFLLSPGDADLDPVSVIIVSTPTHGTLIPSGDQYVYTPAPNFNGTDLFTYKFNDGQVDGNTATVTITVTPANDFPAAGDAAVSTTEDTSVLVALPASDVDGDPLVVTILTSPSHGTLTGSGLNKTYHPAADYFGSDSFVYRVTDAGGLTASGTITVTITPVNDAPITFSQSAMLSEDTTMSIHIMASDFDGDPLTYIVISGPTHGTLSGTWPNIVYTPAANYFGADAVVYRVSDGVLQSAPATVDFSVLSVPDSPIALAQSVTTAYNTPVTITLSGQDGDGDALTYTVLTTPSGGVLSGTAPNLVFTPDTGWSGNTSFTFRVNDGLNNSPAATVSVTVQAAAAIPAAPSGLAATAVSSTQINLTWTDNSGYNEDGFKIERSQNGNTWTQIGTVGPGVTTYASTGLSPNKMYYYRVRAYNVLGNSAFSNTASAKTLR